MKSLYLFLTMVILATVTPVQASWTDYTDNGGVFPDIVFSQYEQTRTVGGVDYSCTITMSYIWQKQEVAGTSESCLPLIVAGGGDIINNTTNNTTNETTNNEITEVCNGCPTITKYPKVKKHYMRTR